MLTAMHRRLPLWLASLIALSLSPTSATADLSRSDKLKALYSNQFAFDRNGVPLITVRIAEGLQTARIESDRPPSLLPDGEEGARVVSGRRWEIRLLHGRAAQVEHFAVLAREPVTHLRKLQAKMKLWKSRGVRGRVLEIGTIFGLKGRVFDNRSHVLLDGPYPTLARARQQAEHLKKRYGLDKVATLPQLKRRPTATFEVRDPDGSTRVTVADALWLAPARGSRLTVHHTKGGASSYWGQIYATVDSAGKLTLVNSVPADRLLAGLVPAEIFPSAPHAALRAQSVAARGELLAKIGTRHLVDPYLLCSTQHCQVYRGAGHEHPRATRAVQATRGQVLVRKDGRLVDTVYSASCGGHTENNDKAWPVEPDTNLRGHLDGDPSRLKRFAHGINERNIEDWLRQRPAVWCNHRRYNKNKFRWTTTRKLGRLRQLLSTHMGRSVATPRALVVQERGVSGRATLLAVHTKRRSFTIRGELNIRRALGGLRSSMFVVHKQTAADGSLSGFLFRGGGWGHGVGMCQTGAIGMAEAGRGHEQILRHYYPGSQLQRLY